MSEREWCESEREIRERREEKKKRLINVPHKTAVRCITWFSEIEVLAILKRVLRLPVLEDLLC